MKYTYKNLLMNKATDDGKGNAGAQPPAQPPAAAPKTDTPAAEAAGNTDDFGYEKTDAKPPEGKKDENPDSKKAEPPKTDPKTSETNDPKASTGYGAEPLKVEDTPPPTPEPKPEIKLEYELDTKALPPEEADKLKQFAAANKMTKEQSEAYVNLRKAELADGQAALKKLQEAQLREVQQKRATWDQELRNDHYFGKEKFEHNVKVVDKVLSDFGSEWKKDLTENKVMLPPNVMRLLARIGEKVYETPTFNGGEPNEPPPEKEDPNSHLDFYNS